jgi:hypothetical protein
MFDAAPETAGGFHIRSFPGLAAASAHRSAAIGRMSRLFQDEFCRAETE